MFYFSVLLNSQTSKDVILALEHVRGILQDRLHFLDFSDPSDRAVLLKTVDSMSTELRQ